MTNTVAILIACLVSIESGGRSRPGDGGRSVGILQVTEICVRDVNRISGTSYSHADMLVPPAAEDACRRWMRHYAGGKTLVEAARMWAGGPDGHLQDCTLRHGEKMRAELRRRGLREDLRLGRDNL